MATLLWVLGLIGAVVWIYWGMKAFGDGNTQGASFIFTLVFAGVLGLWLQVNLIRAAAEGLRLLRRIAGGVAPQRELRARRKRVAAKEVTETGPERVYCPSCRSEVSATAT